MAGQTVYNDLSVDISETRRPELYASAIISFALAITTVSLRFLARRITNMKYWIDDWLVLLALICATGFFIELFFWIKSGLGLHYQVINIEYNKLLYEFLLNVLIGDLLYSFAIAFAKLSILAFYWRIFNVPSIQLPIRIMVCVVISWLITRFLCILLQCIPIQGIWDKKVDAHCGVNHEVFYFGTVIPHLVMDIILLALPMPYIRRLQISKSQKMGVCAMFLVGGFVCIASIMQIITCFKLDRKSPDLTWQFTPVGMWAVLEINLAVSSACLPSLRPIYLLLTNSSLKNHNTHKFSKHTGDSSITSRRTDPHSMHATSSSPSSKKGCMPTPFRNSTPGHADSESTHSSAPVLSHTSKDAVSANNKTPLDGWELVPASCRKMGTVVDVDATPLEHQTRQAGSGITVRNDIRVDMSDREGRYAPM